MGEDVVTVGSEGAALSTRVSIDVMVVVVTPNVIVGAILAPDGTDSVAVTLWS